MMPMSIGSASDVGARDLGMVDGGFEILDAGDHGEHHRQRAELGRPVDRPQLCLEQLGPLEAQADPADAEERVVLDGDVQVRSVLVPADVQRAHDQREAVELADHRRHRLVLLVLARRLVPAEEQELGAHQPDALGTRLDGGGRLARAIDVGDDLDAVAVGGDRRFVARAVLVRPDDLEVLLHPLRRFEVGVVEVDPQRPAGAVEHGDCSGWLSQRRRAGADDGRDPKGAGDDRRVRRRPACRGAEADDARRVDGCRVRRRQVVGNEHHRMAGQLGVGVVDTGEERQHAVADVAEVGGPGGEQWVVDLLQLAGAPLDLVAPGPPGGLAAANRPRHRSQQLRIVEEGLVGAEDGCLLGSRAGLDVVVQLAQLGSRRRHGRAQLLLLGGRILGGALHHEVTSLEMPQRADRQSR